MWLHGLRRSDDSNWTNGMPGPRHCSRRASPDHHWEPAICVGTPLAPMYPESAPELAFSPIWSTGPSCGAIRASIDGPPVRSRYDVG